MNRHDLLPSLRAMLIRWTGLVPALFRHDPLFRYAAIAAILALIFLLVSMGQQRAGSGNSVPKANAPISDARHDAGFERGDPLSPAEPPPPGSAREPALQAPAVAPGRPLEGIDVAPAPGDGFGTLPKKGSSQ